MKHHPTIVDSSSSTDTTLQVMWVDATTCFTKGHHRTFILKYVEIMYSRSLLHFPIFPVKSRESSPKKKKTKKKTPWKSLESEFSPEFSPEFSYKGLHRSRWLLEDFHQSFASHGPFRRHQGSHGDHRSHEETWKKTTAVKSVMTNLAIL